MSEEIAELQVLFDLAAKFVDKNYLARDPRDRGIKIAATINQLIELKKLKLNSTTLQSLIVTRKQEPTG